MNNNKGLTLVELLAVLIVLASIISIVSLMTTRSLKKARVELCEHEVSDIIYASQNYLTDILYNKNSQYKSYFDENGNINQSINVKVIDDLDDNGYIDLKSNQKRKYKKNQNDYIYIKITRNSNGTYNYDIYKSENGTDTKINSSYICK